MHLLPAPSSSYVIPSDGIATGRSADLTNAVDVTRVGGLLRSEPDWQIAQDDTAVPGFAKEIDHAKPLLDGSDNRKVVPPAFV